MGTLLGFLGFFLWGHFFFALSDDRCSLFGGYLLELPVLTHSDAVKGPSRAASPLWETVPRWRAVFLEKLLACLLKYALLEIGPFAEELLVRRGGSYSPPAGFSDDSESPFFMPENGFLSAIPTSLAHMPFCRVMPSNDVGNADIDDTLGDTHDGPNRCVTLSSKGTPACSLIPVQGHVHLTPPASTSSLGNVMLHVYTFLHFFTYLHLFTFFAC